MLAPGEQSENKQHKKNDAQKSKQDILVSIPKGVILSF